jgi:hypothetical protein
VTQTACMHACVTTQELHDRWSSLVSQYFLTTELLRCIPSNAGAPSAAVPTRELHRRRRSSLVTAKELPRSNSTQLRSYAYGGAPSLGYDATGELLRRQNVSPLATLFTTHGHTGHYLLQQFLCFAHAHPEWHLAPLLLQVQFRQLPFVQPQRRMPGPPTSESVRANCRTEAACAHRAAQQQRQERLERALLASATAATAELLGQR